MALCPVCKNEWPSGTTECPVCGRELGNDDEKTEWVILGSFEDRLSADFALETLKSEKIPSVILSKSGFFGNVGLPLNPFYASKSAPYEIAVPEEFVEEASGILDSVLGDKWKRKEED